MTNYSGTCVCCSLVTLIGQLIPQPEVIWVVNPNNCRLGNAVGWGMVLLTRLCTCHVHVYIRDLNIEFIP